MARSDELEANLKAIYAIIWGQCSENMQNRLKRVKDYDAARRSVNCVWILKSIKGVVFGFEAKKYVVGSLGVAYKKWINCEHTDNQTRQSAMPTLSSLLLK